MALEVLPNKGVGCAYTKAIDDASSESLRTLFDEHISKDAEIITDEWNGYLPIKKDYPNLTQCKSEKGSNFPECIYTS